MQPSIIINSRRIRRNSLDIYLIAEAGVNYYEIAHKYGIHPLEAAKMMIREAKAAGCDAVKFQIYKADRLASKYSTAYWDRTKEPTTSQYELFRKYDKLDYNFYFDLMEAAKRNNIDFLATVFDIEGLKIFQNYLPAFKVASADITNKPYLKEIAKFGKPILLSTGASYLSEVWQALEWIYEEEETTSIALLHCVLNYPTSFKDANLGTIKTLADKFPDLTIGYSDHIVPDANMDVLVWAYLLGANIIEKHFTLDKSLPGNDHYHSMDVNDAITFRSKVDAINLLYGKKNKFALDNEIEARQHARRSLVVAKDVSKGSILYAEDLDIKRPGTGIEPKYYEIVVGRTARKDIKKDEILTWDKLD